VLNAFSVGLFTHKLRNAIFPITDKALRLKDVFQLPMRPRAAGILDDNDDPVVVAHGPASASVTAHI
jgi:hypothetical protein